jgi:hypothetical protein
MLAAAFALITLALMPPGSVSSDGASMLAVGTSLSTGHGFAVPCADGVRGRGGECFSTYYPLQSVLAVPFIATGRVTAARRSVSPLDAGRFAAQAVPALAAAMVALLTIAFARLLGADARRATLAGLTVIFATELAVYYRSFFAESLATLLVCLLMWGFLRPDRWRMVAPVAIVGLILAKPQLVLVGLVVGAIAARRERGWRPLVEAVAATAVGTLLYAGYNVLRFSDVTNFGGDARSYHLAAFASSKIAAAAALLLISPGRGWLIYSPIVALGLYGAWRLRHHDLALVALGVLGAVLIPYLGNPGSGFEWGSRYLVPAIPAFVALAWAVPTRAWVAPALAILGFVIVAPTFVAFYERSYAEEVAAGRSPSALYWSLERAPLVDIWGSSERQIEAARKADVRRLINEPSPPAAQAISVSRQRFFRVIAQWWWLTPVVGVPRVVGLSVAVLLLAAAIVLLVRAVPRLDARGRSTTGAPDRRPTGAVA